jgi:hypothetical protein
LNLTKRYFADLVERVVRTFVQAFGGYWYLKGADWDNLFTLNGLKVGGAAAVLSLLMGLGFKVVGNPNSPSALPPEMQPPAPIPADPDPEAPVVVASSAEATPDDWQPPYVAPELP